MFHMSNVSPTRTSPDLDAKMTRQAVLWTSSASQVRWHRQDHLGWQVDFLSTLISPRVRGDNMPQGHLYNFQPLRTHFFFPQ